MYYGAINKDNIIQTIQAVCRVFPNYENAVKLLFGTVSVETDCGLSRDKSKKNGNGLFQIDKVSFEDIKKRTNSTIKALIYNEFDIYIDDVTFECLKYSPLLSCLFARLHYYLKPEKIPDTIKEQSKYWKKYYNTEFGKGKEEDYTEKFYKYFTN